MNPKNWSAKAQALAVIAIGAIIAALNYTLKWNLDPNLVLGIIGLGAVGGAAVAHIDNGETGANNPGEVKPVDTPEVAAAKEVLRKAGITIAVLFCFVLTSCSTGIGRATSLAVSGVPPEIPAAIDSIEAEYNRVSTLELTDINAGKADTVEGQIRKQVLVSDREARIEATNKMLIALRTWIGIEKGKLPSATQDEASKTRTALLDALLKKIEDAKLKGEVKP